MGKAKIKTIFKTIGGLVVLSGIIAGTLLVAQNQDVREKAAPATSLKLTPVTQDAKAGNQQLNLKVYMNTGANQVTGVDLEIAFNPNIFQVTSLTRGANISNFTQEIQKQIDNTSGKILYSTFTLDKLKAVSGTNVETLNITLNVKYPVPAGSYPFSFTNNTSVAAINENQNVVTSLAPATIRIIKDGDVDGDGDVDIVDIGIVVDNYMMNPIPDPRADLSKDGKVNIIDIGIIIDNYGL